MRRHRAGSSVGAVNRKETLDKGCRPDMTPRRRESSVIQCELRGRALRGILERLYRWLRPGRRSKGATVPDDRAGQGES